MNAHDFERNARDVQTLLYKIWGDRIYDGMQGTEQRLLNQWLSFNSTDCPISKLSPWIETENSCSHFCVTVDIPFTSLCEKHLLPFAGKVHIAYRHKGRMVTTPQIVEAIRVIAAQPQNQDRLTMQIAGAIQVAIAPVGCLVLTEAVHTSLLMLGLNLEQCSQGASYTTGAFENDKDMRREAFRAVKGIPAYHSLLST